MAGCTRRWWRAALALVLAELTGACPVALSVQRCEQDDECPAGYYCQQPAGRCTIGEDAGQRRDAGAPAADGAAAADGARPDAADAAEAADAADAAAPCPDLDQDGYDSCADQDCDDTDPLRGPDGDLDGDGTVDCFDLDDDGDGLDDLDEASGTTTGFVTDPRDPDSDADGTDDGLDPAPLTAACAAALLLRDDFSSDPAARWSAVSGEWRWDGDTYASSDNTSGAKTWIGDTTWTDYVLEVSLRPDADNHDLGVLFRARSVLGTANGGEHYYLGFYPGSDQVVLGYMDGVWHVLTSASHPIEAGAWYRIRVLLSGSSIAVEVDGARVLTHQDGRYLDGAVGLRTYQNPATYDDLVVCR